jgi:hypothetical protein
MIGFSLEQENARNAGCLPKTSVTDPAAVCVSCHQDGQQRWAAKQYQPCTPYCMTCHKKSEMDRHHTVGTLLSNLPDQALPLTSEKKVACITCHDMSRTRHDSERWKATSLFDRLFHKESKYKTYFLVMRNDQGQLCLTCH